MSTTGRPKRAFVTGATGFIGGHLARQLLARGYHVSCLVRNPTSAAANVLQAAGAELIPGDVTDADSMRGPLAGADVLFHLAGWYYIGRSDTAPARPVNVGGTRTVLALARELELPNVVYTSTVAVLGNTRGGVVDETYHRRAHFVSEYSRSKTMAYEIANEMAAQELPIRIVLPGVAYGPGDRSVVALFLRAFLRGWLPVIPGADSGLALAHVADVAAGHILAAERGRAGERYILAGQNLTYGEMLRQVAAISGRPAPILLPSWPLPALVGASRLAGRLLSLPPILHPETLAHLNRVTYWGNSRKAETELGWQPRPFETGAAETVQWEMNQMNKSSAMTKLIIQIPCYNEADTLPAVLAGLPTRIEGIDQLEILVIDDGSNDRTGEIARQHGAQHVVRHAGNKGLARAFETGLNTALQLGADIIVNTDGDNQYPGRYIPNLIAPILRQEADLVIADRQTDTIAHFSPRKKRLQIWGSRIVRLASGTRVHDAPSGFRAYSREAALRLNVHTDYTYTLETIIQAGKKGLRIASVPIEVNPQLRTSRLIRSNWGYVCRSAATILRLYAYFEPLRTFFYLSLPFFTLGGALLARFAYYYLIGERGVGRYLQSLFVGGTSVVIGLLIFTLGILADLSAANRRLTEETLYRLKKLEYRQPDSNHNHGDASALDELETREER